MNKNNKYNYFKEFANETKQTLRLVISGIAGGYAFYILEKDVFTPLNNGNIIKTIAGSFVSVIMILLLIFIITMFNLIIKKKLKI